MYCLYTKYILLSWPFFIVLFTPLGRTPFKGYNGYNGYIGIAAKTMVSLLLLLLK